ncbi:MarR family winged helix-turn-helix transcriptional regulator [Paenibacillus thailandensis]|uniref:MarR family winged helix-turn-helix transcriptional regulator n=1 Tax=Paenibacillus thailandensis TaxID=393250 RepID=A0ABW5QYQ1_9BACL
MTDKEDLFQVTTMFRTLLRSITQEWNKRGNEYNLTLPQFKMLYILDKSGPQSVSQLAEAMTITPAAITGISDKLLAEGFVLRERGETDRRVVYITLTDSGKRVLDQVYESQKEALNTFFHLLPEEDIQHLKRIFGRMLSNIENKQDSHER